MPNYIQRPNPPTKIIEKAAVVQESKPELIDINSLANAIAQAVNIRLSQGEIIGKIDTEKDFDTSNTLGRLADQMIVQRGNSKSNFDNLGNIQETKKDQKDVNDTIDLLSKLDN
jgi:hypothetical protein